MLTDCWEKEGRGESAFLPGVVALEGVPVLPGVFQTPRFGDEGPSFVGDNIDERWGSVIQSDVSLIKEKDEQ